jgi:hypothetical protein
MAHAIKIPGSLDCTGFSEMLDSGGLEYVRHAGKFATQNQHCLANDSRNLTPLVWCVGKQAFINALEIGSRQQTRSRLFLRCQSAVPTYICPRTRLSGTWF